MPRSLSLLNQMWQCFGLTGIPSRNVPKHSVTNGSATHSLHGWRKIRLFFFCRAVEWTPSHDGLCDWPVHRASYRSRHPSADRSRLKTCRNLIFGYPKQAPVIGACFIRVLLLLFLALEPIRLFAISGNQSWASTTSFEAFFWLVCWSGYLSPVKLLGPMQLKCSLFSFECTWVRFNFDENSVLAWLQFIEGSWDVFLFAAVTSSS